MRHPLYFMTLAFFFLSLCGMSCERKESQGDITRPETVREITTAVAIMHPKGGSFVQGIVTFIMVPDGIKIIADVEGLTPGKHGFHIHEYGDCSAPDGTSSGGHFNPEDMPHGAPTDAQRHAGDLGNLIADSDGKAHYERTEDHISFVGPHSIIGLAVIVHTGEDDLVSQPTGNAGPRVACGVIGIAKPEK